MVNWKIILVLVAVGFVLTGGSVVATFPTESTPAATASDAAAHPDSASGESSSGSLGNVLIDSADLVHPFEKSRGVGSHRHEIASPALP